ncbi:sperm-associated antigen 1-like [Elysia marginata]|uniref:Sperm-associated antigen 1-like n=1 Tax=Elysia marginata TaxID=1093978 RepID=A0AAV4GQ56_9GAST|nr:sperm-associated antigen 1-like [Elysia marginata]
MSSNIHVEGQTTKKYNLPLSHLDYKYIESCNNPKEIEKIVNVLRSGDEGKFPDLENFAEKRLKELNPKSRALRKDGPILQPGDLSGGDWKSIEEDLKNWTNSMHDQSPVKSPTLNRPVADIVEGDENLPPIRSGNVVLEGKKQKREENVKKRVMPRDYKEWDKVDIDAELEKVDNSDTNLKEKSKRKDTNLTSQVDTSDLKLESWDKAIKDCNKVLSFEKDNIKALLRRGTAFKSKKDFKKAAFDFEKVLAMEPNNKKAEALLAETQKELEKEEKTRQEKGGRRMVIEEVESEDEEEIEEVEVEAVNGHSVQNEVISKPTTDSKPMDEVPLSHDSNLTNQQKSVSPSQKLESSLSPQEVLDSQVSNSVVSNQAQCSLPSESQNHALSEDCCAPSALSSTAETSSQPSPSLSSPQITKIPSSLPEPSEQAPPASATEADADSFSRPQYVQTSLPLEVQRLKDEGNQLFRSGQYADAIEKYSRAVTKIEKGESKGEIFKIGYAEAYVDYKHAISIDSTADQAHQGASRCQSSLQMSYGSKTWREKIPNLVLVQPWEIPLIVDEAGMHRSMSSSVSLSDKANISNTTTDQPANGESQEKPILESANTTTAPAVSQQSNESTQSEKIRPTSPEDFEEVKAKGNLHVQKGQFAEAIKCYSKCISLKPDQVACYTNRALCYLKLNQASDAATDCEMALQMEPKNPKALYRRALARKMTQQYKLSLQDLVELLKLEPKNTAAQKEMDSIKKLYKEELESLKQQKKATEQETKDPKGRKKMKIEEVDEEDDEERPARGKGSEKSKFQNKSRSASGAKTKGSNGRGGGGCCAASPESPIAQDQPVAPPCAPRLMKTTPYEFCQAWNSLKPCQGVQPYAEILRQLTPADLPTVISNKLDGQMLQIIVKCVHEEIVLKGENNRGYEILNNLCEVPRFSTVAMFMSGKEKKEVSSVLAILSKTPSSAYSSMDIARLKSKYSVK